ncbi:hypothetical protein EIP91_010509 [Steccherinum ochraceum]|uniref:F-box domain-containing protein n=1 Tax=Steccherinum ochraceum TaxID=92696 RepID=A0A4R0R5V0_9APHY|nr:hypothetical protein EIP91_010509 [Steccherinum ochraceum]
MDVRRDVRNLGRVGRIFREPCLNALSLWYHQGGIGELFRMISAVKGYRYNDEPCQKWDLKRPLQAEDIPTMLFYSRRIREMCFYENNVFKTKQSSFDISLLLGKVLFPRLRVLSWYSSITACNWNLDFVLDSMGDEVTDMLGAVSYRSAPKFMASMEKRHRQLSYISLWENEIGQDNVLEETSRFFRDVLPHAQNLRELHLENSILQCFDIWGAIPLFPLLGRLTLILTDLESCVPSIPASYHTLTGVTVIIKDARVLCRILDRVSFPNLCEIQLILSDDIDASVLHGVLVSVASACGSQLTSLIIAYNDYRSVVPDGPISNEVLGLDDLRLLMEKHPKLEVLDLDVHSTRCLWAMGDGALQEIVRAWGRRLRVLRLDPDSKWSFESQKCVTLKGLEHIALHCPHLTTLGLNFVGVPTANVRSATVHIEPNGSTTGPQSNYTLRRLDIGCSPLESLSVSDMALYLSSLLPNLKTIRPAKWMGEQRPRWKMVEDIVLVAGLARKQERLVFM